MNILKMKKQNKIYPYLFLILLSPFAVLQAKTVTVTVQGISFEPMITHIQPGDTVQWLNMNVHSTTSVDNLIPDKEESWDSPIGHNYEKAFTHEGIYLYKCKPHSNLGMAGVIIVGNPSSNLEVFRAADKQGPLGNVIKKAISYVENL